ncbi:MAG: bifunctional 4-hydroxy-2-oxoglutarate aldolase/2-dehydro-3-deoxy-phosphogluconate aldolase [Rhodothermales bacterium]
MSRSQITQRFVEAGAAAVIRMSDPARLLKAAEAVLEGGVSVLEVTMTTPNALGMLDALVQAFGDRALIGVGSVLDAGAARRAIDAGARFVVSPVLKEEVIAATHRHDLPVMPGTFSPTEVQRAHDLGADIIKVFPAHVLGMAYIRAVLAPLPHLKLMPTGGVTLANAGDWLRAGACAVGVGSALFDRRAIAEARYAVLTDRARRLCRSIEEGRTG